MSHSDFTKYFFNLRVVRRWLCRFWASLSRNFQSPAFELKRCRVFHPAIYLLLSIIGHANQRHHLRSKVADASDHLTIVAGRNVKLIVILPNNSTPTIMIERQGIWVQWGSNKDKSGIQMVEGGLMIKWSGTERLFGYLYSNQIFRKDTEPLYQSILYLLVSLLSGIFQKQTCYVKTACVCFATA